MYEQDRDTENRVEQDRGPAPTIDDPRHRQPIILLKWIGRLFVSTQNSDEAPQPEIERIASKH